MTVAPATVFDADTGAGVAEGLAAKNSAVRKFATKSERLDGCTDAEDGAEVEVAKMAGREARRLGSLALESASDDFETESCLEGSDAGSSPEEQRSKVSTQSWRSTATAG